MLRAGDIAPDFAIGDRTLYVILLDGPVVLFFFPKAFTPVCAKEATGFCRQYEELRRGAAEVIGVSADRQETNDRFRSSLDLPFPLLGDRDGAIMRAYRVRWPLLGWARRVTYVIGPDRKVSMVFNSERDAAGHVARARQTVAGERHL
jgi:peroxiredoxin